MSGSTKRLFSGSSANNIPVTSPPVYIPAGRMNLIDSLKQILGDRQYYDKEVIL